MAIVQPKKKRSAVGFKTLFTLAGCILFLLMISTQTMYKESLSSLRGAVGSHHCVNEDFQPVHKAAVWTMLNDNLKYVSSAAKMGRGVNAHTKTPHDLVVMEIEGKPLGDDNWKILNEVGFKRCVVKSIPPPRRTRHDLGEKFGVLHVWAMTVYDTVLFIDADTLVKKSLDHLINMDLQGKSIGVTKDFREGHWVETFNSGVLLVHPSEKEYDRLMTLLRSGIEYEYIMSDQGFLNVVYKDDWHEIGFLNNANLAVYTKDRKTWDSNNIDDINIIHYTMKKPWKCGANGPYGPICKIWLDAP
ncbi:nucleotide-diphospho-sugar transferase [Chaetoceros tenuissimus]|uniref:Nucleotide-diphospho-sugar transferase n=1 Tax=Chaetoceros tenuissimus TaxID=426638 RepID=A0AAD3H142_9STRA|nr:nucleotide-diphospho-sugar transferase [Chaetoceros tenuissimus]